MEEEKKSKENNSFLKGSTMAHSQIRLKEIISNSLSSSLLYGLHNYNKSIRIIGPKNQKLNEVSL